MNLKKQKNYLTNPEILIMIDVVSTLIMYYLLAVSIFGYFKQTEHKHANAFCIGVILVLTLFKTVDLIKAITSRL